MRAGVIGIGYWGSKVAEEYIGLMQKGVVDSLILCDINESKLEPFIHKAQTCHQIDKVMKNIDIVHVCTPNYSHYGITRKALESGASVLVEKPMAEDVNHAFDLVELSMSKGLILKVGHIFRFANIVREISKLCASGSFGEPYYYSFEWTHLIQPRENVDVIYDLLPHPLDIMNFLTNKWPISFMGIGKAFRRSKLAENAFIEAIYDGFTANFHLSWVIPIKRRKLEIVGSKKSIVADCVKQTAVIYEESGSKELIVNPNNTIRDEILNFVESVKTGKSDHNSSIIGVRNIEMIDQARKSVKILDSARSVILEEEKWQF